MDRRRTPAQPRILRLLSPLRDFLATETAGGILLAAGALVALVWANSPWSSSYERLWASKISVGVAGHTLELDLQHWINDGLMAIFFLVVGLEIKRELTTGHLSSRRSALLPFAAAIGGMVVPAMLYLAIAGGVAARGWAIPMATDIALALGVAAVAAPRLAPPMRVFLLGLAIVDDIGAIIVIAVFYSDGVSWPWLAAALASIVLTVAMQRVGVYNTAAYLVVGAFLWLGLHEAGIHATIAGVVMGLLAPTTARLAPEFVDTEELLDLSSAEAAQATTAIARNSVSVVEWLQHVLHPWTSYAIVPLFALANSGIQINVTLLRHAASSAITWGIIVGLVIGKPLGITLASRLAVRAQWADDPEGATRRTALGIGGAAGIGFTVALFITELAFTDEVQRSEAKLAILVASATAAIIAALLLRSPDNTSD